MTTPPTPPTDNLAAEGGPRSEMDLYICPTTGETESRTLGGFTVCCDHPRCPGAQPMTAEREGLAEIEAMARGIHAYQEYSTCWNDDQAGAESRMGTPMRPLEDHGREFYRGLARAARDALADLLAARDRRVRAEAVMQAEGDIRDYRAAYSRCVDLAEEWQALDFEPATQADLSTLTTINRCGRELARALDGAE